MAKKRETTFSIKVPDGFGGAGFISGESLTSVRKWADRFPTYEEAVEAARLRGAVEFSVHGNY